MSLPDLCLLCFVPGDGVEPVFPSGVCVVEALLLLWNKLSWSILHFAGAYSDAGGGRGMVLLRSPRLVCLPLRLVGWLLAFFCFKGAEMVAGDVVVWRLDPARLSLDGGSRRRRGRMQELEKSGRGPSRWATADGLFYCDFDQSLSAMELLRFMVVLVFLSGGDVRRRRVRALTVREESRDLFVIFFV